MSDHPIDKMIAAIAAGTARQMTPLHLLFAALQVLDEEDGTIMLPSAAGAWWRPNIPALKRRAIDRARKRQRAATEIT